MKIPVPKPPLSRIIKECDYGSCPKCKSTEVRRYFTNTLFEFGPKIGCIHPECENYYRKDV